MNIKTLVVVLLMISAGLCAAAEVTVGPYVHFYERGEVTVFYKTDAAVTSIIEYGMGSDLSESVEDAIPKTDHELIVPIRPETKYSYRIVAGVDVTETFEFYSSFDYGVDPFPAGDSPYPVDSLTPLYEQAAEYIINSTGIDKGVCIDYGCGQGRLAYEIAKRTNLKIIGFEEDAGKISAARNALHQADVYGSRITVMQASLSSLECSDYTANLIVSDKMISDGLCPGTAEEMFRVLRPDGGIAFLGQPTGCPNPLSETVLDAWLGGYGDAVADSNGTWAVINRGTLAGAGEWSHNWANPAATTCSEDTEVAYPVQMIWYGQPGPRYIVDRHHRPGCSLYKSGRLVVPGLHRVMTLDAYNGSRLWDMSIPNSVRVGVLKDAGWVALAEDYVYVVSSDDCVGLEGNTGEPVLNFAATQEITGEAMDWGYLAVDDERLIGSGQKAGASRIGLSFDIYNGYIPEVYQDNQTIITSRYLFCFDRYDDTASPLWIYKHGTGADSVIPNPAICVTEDAVYFLESRNSSAISDSDGRVTLSVLLDGNNEYLIKLNKSTGAVVWEEPVNLPFEHVIWLQYANGVLLATGTYGATPWSHGLHAFDPVDGSSKWSKTFTAALADYYHGGQDKHPAIVGNSIYWQPNKYNLQTGAPESWGGVSQSGCGTISTSANYAFNRYSNPRMHSLSGGSWSLCSETRIGCYINIVPAGGMVLVPESGSGCTCSYSLQASMGFMTAD